MSLQKWIRSIPKSFPRSLKVNTTPKAICFPTTGPTGFWNRFWFKPADPTTLGFMRILVGSLILYSHIIYSFDLDQGFGKDGWVSLDSVNAKRHGYPWLAPLKVFPPPGQRGDP